MDELKLMLNQDEQHWDTRTAVHKLSPEIYAAAAQLRLKRQERAQLLAFIAAVLMMLGVAVYVLYDYHIHGTLTKNVQLILAVMAAGTVLVAAIAPILAYFAEEDLHYESL